MFAADEDTEHEEVDQPGNYPEEAIPSTTDSKKEIEASKSQFMLKKNFKISIILNSRICKNNVLVNTISLLFVNYS